MHVIRGASAKEQRALRDIFTGEVYSHTFVDDTIGQHLRLTLVRFMPGGRTTWHTHEFEQGLIVVEGRGVLATDAEEVPVSRGDIIIIPPGERHWHGATEATMMAHISITTPGRTTVLEAVERIRGNWT
jgi:quercetin dioxygenase-like cupin family protein